MIYKMLFQEKCLKKNPLTQKGHMNQHEGIDYLNL